MCAQSVGVSAARTLTTTATLAPTATNQANREVATRHGITQKSAAPARRPLDCRVIRLATIRSDHAGTGQDSLRRQLRLTRTTAARVH